MENKTRYGEPKTRINVMLTPTAIATLDKMADQLDVSRSEVVEQMARDLNVTAEKKILGEFFAS